MGWMYHVYGTQQSGHKVPNDAVVSIYDYDVMKNQNYPCVAVLAFVLSLMPCQDQYQQCLRWGHVLEKKTRRR